MFIPPIHTIKTGGTALNTIATRRGSAAPVSFVVTGHSTRTNTVWRRLVGFALLALISATTGVLAQDPISVSQFNLPPQDAAGWSVLVPAQDSRLIYVDAANGNDSTAVVYAPGAAQVGSNPQAPVGPIQAFRTLAAAQTRLRQDQPDWMLLRAGGVWTESLEVKRGRSPSERQVVIPYGSGARPELRTGSSHGILNHQLVNVAIIGLRFWAHTRDTDGPHFTGYGGGTGFSLFTRSAGDPRQVRDVLIEDCVFRSYRNNVLTGRSTDGAEPIRRFVLRRSIISKNFNAGDHAQGLYHIGAGQPVQASVLLQENLFDHNGWRVRQTTGNNDQSHGQATMYNHNTYFTAGNGVIFQRNLFLRASSIGNKWTSVSRGVVIDDNLFAEGEIAMSMGGNHEGPYRFQDFVVRNNVMVDIGRTRPTNRSLAWYAELQDWQSGEFYNNLMAHQRAGIGNSWAIRVLSNSASRDVVVRDNVIANVFASSNQALVELQSGGNVQNFLLRDNIVQGPGNGPLVSFTSGGYLFGGSNQYHSSNAQPGQLFRVNNSPVGLSAWITATGDSGASNTAPSFPDPSRDLERYIAHLGLGSTFNDFLNAVYGQSKANWNPALTAGPINDWLRAGFGMSAETSDLLFENGFEMP